MLRKSAMGQSSILLVIALPSLGSLQIVRDGAPDGLLREVRRVELDERDGVLEGKGRFEIFSYTVRSTGRLYVHATSDGADLFLRIGDASGALLGEDDDGGGGRTPCLELGVERGQSLQILVASKLQDAFGAGELRLAEAPEGDATLDWACAVASHPLVPLVDRSRGSRGGRSPDGFDSLASGPRLPRAHPP